MVITLRSRVINGYSTRNRGLRKPPKTVKVVIESAGQVDIGHLSQDGETYQWESSSCETDIGEVDDSGSVPREVTDSRAKIYTSTDDVNFVVNNGLTVVEALRVTMNPCSRQNLYQMLRVRKLDPTFVNNPTVVHDDEMSPLTECSYSTPVNEKKRKRKSSRDKNAERIERNTNRRLSDERIKEALKEGARE